MTDIVAEVRHPAAAVRPLAEALRVRLADHAERVEIGGSLRRGKPDVKDVELVALNPTPGFYTYLDELVAAGKVTKARYGAKGTFRWGEKYRGLDYNGLKYEIFTADSDNFGYVHWLRTGPGDANTLVMTVLKQRRAPFIFRDGYAWYGDDLIPLPDEISLFNLLGMPFVEPHERAVWVYRRYLDAPDHRFGTVQPRPLVQHRLDLGAYDYVEPEAKHGGAVSTTPATAAWWRACREWDALPPAEKRRRMIVEELEFGSIENWRRQVAAYKQKHGLE